MSPNFLLQWPDIWAVAICTLCWSGLIEQDLLAIRDLEVSVTCTTRDFGVATLQRKMGPFVMVEGRGNPALRIVAIQARCPSCLHELALVRVLVAILTNL